MSKCFMGVSCVKSAGSSMRLTQRLLDERLPCIIAPDDRVGRNGMRCLIRDLMRDLGNSLQPLTLMAAGHQQKVPRRNDDNNVAAIGKTFRPEIIIEQQ